MADCNSNGKKSDINETSTSDEKINGNNSDMNVASTSKGAAVVSISKRVADQNSNGGNGSDTNESTTSQGTVDETLFCYNTIIEETMASMMEDSKLGLDEEFLREFKEGWWSNLRSRMDNLSVGTEKKSSNSSKDDDSDNDSESDTESDTAGANKLICQYTEVKKTGGKYQLHFQDGILNIDGKEHFVKEGTCDLDL